MRRRPIRTQVIRSSGKELLVTSVNLHDKRAFATLPHAISTIFEELAPFAKNRRQVAYVRDMPTSATRWSPGPWSDNDQEMSVTLPDWRIDRKKVIDSFAEELHRLIRYQNVGVPKTLGENLVAEAMARAYAETKSGLRPPWVRGTLSQQAFDMAKRQWSSTPNYDHAAWFERGPLGKWTGYKLADRLNRAFFTEAFDLKTSLTVPASQLKPFLQA